MKKTLFVALSALCAMPSLAGVTDAPVAAVVPAPEMPDCTITLQYGIMHTGFTENPHDQVRSIPSVLYGFSVGAQWEVAASDKYSHHVGASIGYYLGTQQDRFLNGWNDVETTVDTEVEVYPILLTYNLEYKVNDKLTLYGGVRGGVIIRDTTWSATPADLYKSEKDSAITPMLSVGVGARTFITEKLSFDLGYDFGFSFGQDCDFSENYSSTDVRSGCGSDCRYYGTIKAGFSYSF